MPLVSVLMSVYNGAEYLEDAIDSILSQTFSDFEFIITNDCSSDKTGEILELFANKDERIIVIHNQVNKGLPHSLNAMLALAKGKFIARMDADDIAKLNRFETQVKVLQHNPEIGVVFSDTIFIDNEGNKMFKSWRPDIEQLLDCLPHYNFIPHPTVMIHKDNTAQLLHYNPNVGTLEDVDLWYRLHKNGVKFHYINLPLLYYRINPSSVQKIANGKADVAYYKYLAALGLYNNNKLYVYKRLLLKIGLKNAIVFIFKSVVPFAIFIKIAIARSKNNGKLQQLSKNQS